MEHAVFFSLFLVAAVGIITPMLTHLVPKNLMPEAAALLIAGIVIGPNMLGWATLSQPIVLLKEIGMGFLFLLAGYEVNLSDLKGRRGAESIASWTISFGLAVLVVWLLGWGEPGTQRSIAFSLALTATALGTLLPIIKERGLLGTDIGHSVMAHGTIGEIFPIALMAFFLSSRGYDISTIVFLLFIGFAALVAAIPVHIRRFGTIIVHAVHLNSHTTAQMTVRLVFAVLAALMAVAVALDLDVVLGAFAAGMIVRRAVPDGREELEIKLDGIAYGIFIPLFFVTTGMSIDLSALSTHLGFVLSVLGLLIAIRGLPIFLLGFGSAAARGSFREAVARMGESAHIALYASTSLPIIVAVTEVASSYHVISHSLGSALVLAGGLSVLVFPALCVLIPLKYSTISHEEAGEGEEWQPWIEHSWHSEE